MLSILGMILGPVLLLLSGSCLFWNEGRAVQTARSLAEGQRIVVTADPSRIDPANDGKLVHIAGETRTASSLQDVEFGVEIRAVRLVRTVEMYQWKEDRRGRSGPDYHPTWSAGRIDSALFERRDGHENPTPRFRGASFASPSATLQDMRLSEQALWRLPASLAVRLDERFADPLRRQLNAPVQAVDGALYVGADPAQPRIGDLRISFRVAPEGTASFIGRQDGGTLVAYQTRSGDSILLAREGIAEAATMFTDARHRNVFLTWMIRLGGLLMMVVGFNLLLLPLRSLASAIPLLGGLLRLAVSMVAAALSAVAGSVIIASAWLWYRPLLSLAILSAGLGLAALLRMRAAGPQPPPLPPPAAVISRA